jgi:ArsR family transcriptional regulator
MRMNAEKLDVRAITGLFRALGDETRVRIVALLSHGELCVCHVQEALGLTQPNASRQLSILLNAGVVERRRSANWVYFKLAPQGDALRREELKSLVRAFSSVGTIQKDLERLLLRRGPEACK